MHQTNFHNIITNGEILLPQYYQLDSMIKPSIIEVNHSFNQMFLKSSAADLLYLGKGVKLDHFSIRLLVSAPKSYDPLQPAVKSPGILLRCPLDGASTACDEVVIDTTGKYKPSSI